MKHFIKKMIYRAGFDLHRLTPNANPYFQLLTGLNRFEIDLVLDVGANVGQFAAALRAVGYSGRLISFEPLEAAHLRLVAAAKGDANWVVHSRCAIGAEDGEIDMNVSGNSVSSSVLPMLDAHAAAAKGSGYVGLERVPIHRLDSLALGDVADARRFFIKIDTQGFEWQVLDGADETLRRARGVLCELSLVPLYEGQHLWLDVIERLATAGFTLWSVQPGFTDARDGRTLQVDAIFFRLDD